MPFRRTTDGSVDDLPRYVRAGFGLDLSWKKNAKCKTQTGLTGKAWTTTAAETITVGDEKLPGRKLIQMAVMVCRTCPVQWECARYAIKSEAEIGTWGTEIAKIKMLGAQHNYNELLDAAQECDIPVDDMAKQIQSAKISLR
jgi:hypothetical protein